MTHEQRVAVFDGLRAKHLRFLTAVLWRLTDDRELFEEAMQYALLGLWRHAHKLEGQKAARYIYRIALSANSKAWRQRIGRNGDIARIRTGLDESPDEQTRRADLATQVRRMISRLPDKQGRALVMRYLEQKEYGTIAACLGCSEATARSHVTKAVARLRQKLTAEQEWDHGRA